MRELLGGTKEYKILPDEGSEIYPLRKFVHEILHKANRKILSYWPNLRALVESLGIGYGECAPECVVKLCPGIQVLLLGPWLGPRRHHNLL